MIRILVAVSMTLMSVSCMIVAMVVKTFVDNPHQWIMPVWLMATAGFLAAWGVFEVVARVVRVIADLQYVKSGDRLPIPRKLLHGPYGHEIVKIDVAGHWHAKGLAESDIKTYSPRGGPMPMPSIERAPEPTALPPPVTPRILPFSHVPTSDAILLAHDATGRKIVCSSWDLLHVAFCGSTGRGKSTASRLLLAQLLATGADVTLIDPHFMPIVPAKDGQQVDWRSIESRLVNPVIYEPNDGEEFLGELVQELRKRIEQGRRGQTRWHPVFVSIDEGPLMAARAPNFINHLATLLREGRKYGIFVLLSSQDFLIKTLGSSTGALSNMQTVYYFGGDPYSARTLLKVPKADTVLGIDPTTKGDGRVLFMNAKSTPDPIVARVPWITNEDVDRMLLGIPTRASTPEPFPAGVTSSAPAETVTDSAPPNVADPAPPNSVTDSTPPDVTTSAPAETEEEKRVRYILEQSEAGASRHKIAETLAGCANGGKYQRYRRIVDATLAAQKRM